MNLNESIVENAALEWFREESRVAPTLTPALSQEEKKENREAIRRLNPAISVEARATVKHYLQVRFERRPNP